MDQNYVPPPQQQPYYQQQEFYKQNYVPPPQQQLPASSYAAEGIPSSGDYYYEQQEAESARTSFLFATVMSILFFFIFTPLCSCFPYLFLFKYRNSSVAAARYYGKLSASLFYTLFVINSFLFCAAVITAIVLGSIYGTSRNY
ncbi:hypothetical protein ABK040_013352 [Willaertia magna]